MNNRQYQKQEDNHINRNSSNLFTNNKLLNFNQIKDLPFFKSMLKQHDVSVLREILPSVVKKFQGGQLNHTQNIYIPSANIEKYHAGYPLPATLSVFTNQCPIYMIGRYSNYIIKFLFFLNIPIVKYLRIMDKLLFYSQCTVMNYKFNQFVYHVGDLVQEIFLILSGELKEITQIRIAKHKPSKKNIRVVEQGYFVGVEELGNGIPVRNHSLVSNSNQTKLLKIKKQLLQKYVGYENIKLLSQQNSKESALILQDTNRSIKQAFYQPKYERRCPIVKNLSKSSLMNAQGFIKKYQQFALRQSIGSDKVFEKYIEQKKLLFRLKQSNETSRKKLKTNNSNRDIFAIRKMLQGCRQVNKTRKNSTNIVSESKDLIWTIKKQELLTKRLKNYIHGIKYKNIQSEGQHPLVVNYYC